MVDGIVTSQVVGAADSIGRMFDRTVVAELAGLVDRLAGLPSAVDDDATRIDVIGGLEKLKAAAYAAQFG